MDVEITNQINELIRQLDNKNLERYSSELKLLASLFIWHKTLFKSGSTVGHDVFGLRFNDLNATKSYVQLFCSVVYPFIEQKLDGYNLAYFTQLQKSFKFFNLINFLVFLRTGSYLNIWHRLFKIDPQFAKQHPTLNQATYEFMNRELVWSTAIDFLTFIIPIIDLNKSWTKLKSLFVDERSFCLNEFYRPIKSTEKLYEKCNLCSESPIDPHEIGCLHVYCYYCVMSEFELNNGLTCFKCKYRIDQKESIRRINLRCLIDN